MPDYSPPTDNNDPRIVALANEIIGDWPQIMAVWDEFRVKYDCYFRSDLEADRMNFLKQALWMALGGRHLRALVNRLNEQGLGSPAFAQAASPLLGTGFALQSYVNGRWQSQDALVGGRRLLEACDHTCRIAINGAHRGTGVLIRPTIVATAAHVIAPLVDPQGRPIADSLKRLSICFLDADALLPDDKHVDGELILAELHEQWLGYFSPQAPGEGGSLYAIDSIDGIHSGVGPWDLALIRLARQPRPSLKGYRLLEGEPPDVAFGTHILHHPADALGAPMGLIWSIGEMKQSLGAPPLRWLHDANTDAGSSGAPCFDNSWRIVALHQAGRTAIASANQSNRAVPIYAWASEVDRLAATVSVIPYLSQVQMPNGERAPVFGRTDLQAGAWRAMMTQSPPEQRVFVVLGDAGTGKTFTTVILTELARLAGRRLVSLDVRNAQADTPLQFAQRIIGAFGASPFDAPKSATFTTELRGMRNDLVPRLVQELETIAAGEPLWLVLDGLEVCDSAANGIGQLIEGLLGKIADAPHLNLALIGWKASVRTNYAEILSGGPSVDEIVDQLLLELAPPGFEPAAAVTQVLRNLVETNLGAQTQSEPFSRAAAAAELTKDTVRVLLTGLAQPGATGGNG